jgi:hypothetical protein
MWAVTWVRKTANKTVTIRVKTFVRLPTVFPPRPIAILTLTQLPLAAMAPEQAMRCCGITEVNFAAVNRKFFTYLHE